MAMDAIGIMNALEEQLLCYQRLAKLAQVQHEHVQQADPESLLEVLGRRQVELDQLAGLEQSLAPAKREWQRFIETLDAAGRDRAELLVRQSRGLLEQITRADQNDVMVLQQRKINIGRQLEQSSAKRQVNRAYAAASAAPRASKVDLSQ